MKRLHALTIVEVLVVIGLVIPVVLMVAVCARAAAKAANDKQLNGAQLQALVAALCMWSEGNSKTHDLPGSYTANPPAGYPPNATDPSVVGRCWALVAPTGVDPVSPSYFVSRAPGVPEAPWSHPTGDIKEGVTTSGAAGFGSNNVSYALLATTVTGGAKNREWHDYRNGRCPLICDRNRGTPAAPASSWSETGWQGSVSWGDAHASFENSSKNLIEVIGGNACFATDLWAPATGNNAGMVNPGC